VIDYHDWRGLPATKRDEHVAAYTASDRRRGFVLSRPPLARLALIRLDEHVHQLIWSVHHIVVDGWCLSLLLNELLEIYQTAILCQEPELRSIRPFRDYGAWLGQRADRQAEEHWRQALHGVTAPLTLGLDGLARVQGSTHDDSRAERETSLPVDLTAALEDLGRSRR